MDNKQLSGFCSPRHTLSSNKVFRSFSSCCSTIWNPLFPTISANELTNMTMLGFQRMYIMITFKCKGIIICSCPTFSWKKVAIWGKQSILHNVYPIMNAIQSFLWQGLCELILYMSSTLLIFICLHIHEIICFCSLIWANDVKLNGVLCQEYRKESPRCGKVIVKVRSNPWCGSKGKTCLGAEMIVF